MFSTIARFELRYQLLNPVFWVAIVLFFLLTLGATTVESIRLGSGGNIHTNAPTAIAQIQLIMSLFFMFVTTAFVGNVVVRDDETDHFAIESVRSGPTPVYSKDVAPLFEKYCLKCHDAAGAEGGVILDELSDNPDPYALDVSLAHGPQAGRRPVERGGVARIVTRDHLEDQRRVRDGGGYRSDLVERAGESHEAIARHHAVSRLHADDATERGGLTDGSTRIGPERNRHHPRRDGRGRPTARASGDAICAPRISRRPERRVLR